MVRSSLNWEGIEAEIEAANEKTPVDTTNKWGRKKSGKWEKKEKKKKKKKTSLSALFAAARS